MGWHEEIYLSRLSDAEAGMVAKVRLTFHNCFAGLETDADDVFGVGWPGRVESLRKAGILKVVRADGRIRLSVIAKGDRKRDLVRKSTLKYRQKNLRTST